MRLKVQDMSENKKGNELKKVHNFHGNRILIQ